MSSCIYTRGTTLPVYQIQYIPNITVRFCYEVVVVMCILLLLLIDIIWTWSANTLQVGCQHEPGGSQSPVQQHMVWPWSWGRCWGGPVWFTPGGAAGSCCLFHLHNSRRKWFSHCCFPTQEMACWCCCGLLNKRDPSPPTQEVCERCWRSSAGGSSGSITEADEVQSQVTQLLLLLLITKWAVGTMTTAWTKILSHVNKSPSHSVSWWWNVPSTRGILQMTHGNEVLDLF